ncbi:MAG: nucleotidyl transferase AbiEii/AbiGii toxin family protein [Kosmotoga sp.]|nr:MAG: nucleotidyl transferase AbiEii/AbiGii toxin family protein [Kosmotoga sp.]
MIDSICYSKDWINSRRTLFKRNDPSIIEKTIYAFSLLEKMRAANIDFIFKGGSSLLLILKNFRRFSIDIDIIYERNIDDLEKKLENILNDGVFTSLEKDERRSKVIPKAHYKFFYYSQINKRRDSILLDILFENNVYPEVTNIPIKHPVIKISGRITDVIVPTVDAILGDKLTAFAPNTIGIKYATGKHIEIIKQLFDIGSLFDNCTDPDIILKSFQAISNKEISYRKASLNQEEVLKDIFNTALTLGMNGQINPDNFAELKRGVQSCFWQNKNTANRSVKIQQKEEEK